MIIIMTNTLFIDFRVNTKGQKIQIYTFSEEKVKFYYLPITFIFFNPVYCDLTQCRDKRSVRQSFLLNPCDGLWN